MSTTDAVRIVSSSALDTDAHAALQQRVFGEILEDNDIPLDRLGPEVFRWKLAPPSEEARLAIIERDGVLLSSCTAFPVALGTGAERRRGWHLCDAVTAPEARGRGLFRRVLNTLREALPADDWLFAFPNGQSRPAFEREGFFTVERIPLWFRPVIGRVSDEPTVAPVHRFGLEHDGLAERLTADRGLTAVRSAAYLDWRYNRHPFFEYQCLQLQGAEGPEGLLVVNRMKARGRVSMWVMELMAMNRASERTLAKKARFLAYDQKCDVLLSMSKGRLPGAVRLPACFLPKQHVLMVRSGGPGESKPIGRWDVYTGDWDTF